jgi:hypothetical protein
MDGDLDGFSEVVVIRGEECQYDPVRHVARIMCENCAHINEVDVWIENGEPGFMGFVCEKCGHWNGPQ